MEAEEVNEIEQDEDNQGGSEDENGEDLMENMEQ